MDLASSRAADLAALASRTFDLLVLGGGATGAGVARDAALRGFSVALVEKKDFGAGTSSKSSKLIHGGLRYLEQAQFKLVFEGTNERGLLLKRVPHLVRPLRFLVPAYRRVAPGLVKLNVGLWLYDGLSRFSSPELHKGYRKRGLLAIEPLLDPENLAGGIVYSDAATDDARLTLENLLDARALGAVALNHCRAVGVLRDAGDRDRVIGVEVEDSDGDGRRLAVRARVVVNASGPWCDEVRALLGEPPLLRRTKGVHLVVDAARLPVRHAVVMMGPRDRRVIFAIPWGMGRTVIGTTDTDHRGSADEVFATAEDVDYLFDVTNRYFPTARLVPDDVLATWAGLRPLVAPSPGVSESDTSREHHIVERRGFVTIAGGKLTTYRRMAAEVVDRVGAQLGKVPICTTATRPLPGAVGIDGDDDLAAITAGLVQAGLEAAVAEHLCFTFGARAPAVARRVKGDPDAGQRLDPELPFLVAEVDEAVEVELARTVEDVLGRRLPLILRSRDQGLAAAPRVAARMARPLGWSPERQRLEVERYAAVVDETRRFRRRPQA